MKTIDLDFVKAHLPPRPDDAHKGTMGTLLSITGSRGFSGAAILSAAAALRTGVGLLYQALPECIYPIFASSVFESVCVPLKGNGSGTLCAKDFPALRPALDKATAVLIGCGLGNNEDTAALLHEVLRYAKCPVILDADGINALASHIYFLEDVKVPLILTPHVKEFSRLTGWSVEETLADPAGAASYNGRFYRGKITIALKSHRTYIANGDKLYVNTAGNSGMAKGGSGDVLAGIVASLTAQGVPPFEAAVSGVHIHALAGDIAAEKLSRTAMLPRDIISALPKVYKQLTVTG